MKNLHSANLKFSMNYSKRHQKLQNANLHALKTNPKNDFIFPKERRLL